MQLEEDSNFNGKKTVFSFSQATWIFEKHGYENEYIITEQNGYEIVLVFYPWTIAKEQQGAFRMHVYISVAFRMHV